MLNTRMDYQKTILDSLPFAAYIKDLNGKIIAKNSKLLEYITEENGTKTFIPYEKTEIYLEDACIVKFKKPLIFERKLVQSKENNGKNGIWHRITKLPVFNERKEVTSIVVFLENINERKEAEQGKETYVATLTHDLKTPTIAQIRMLELLLDGACGELNSEQTEIMEQMLKSARYMLGMISKVLAVYKFENGSMKFEFSEFNLKELMFECIDELSTLLDERNLTLETEILTDNCIIAADKMQIKRVLINLISNSISYAIKNTEVKISLEKEDENLIFKTTNSSPYIPPDILNTLFKKYVSNPAHSKFDGIGTGLGLYLTEKIISAHNGRIIAKSSEENKNTFGFIIPKNIIPKDPCSQNLIP